MHTMYIVETARADSVYHNKWTKLIECDDLYTCNTFLYNEFKHITENNVDSSINFHVSKDHLTWTISNDERTDIYQIKTIQAYDFEDCHKTENDCSSDKSLDEIYDDIVTKTLTCKDENELKTHLKSLTTNMQKNNPKNFNKFCNMIVKNLNLVKDSEESNDSEE